MIIKKSIQVVDTHTMGEPTRIITGNIGKIPGDSLADKKAYLERKYDWLRKTVLYEPRGHKDMFGAILLDPTHSEADLGVIFMDGGGYLNMCGHGIIGSAVAVIETGIISTSEDFIELTLEAPAGLVKLSVKLEEGGCKEVTVKNVPSFAIPKSYTIELDSGLLIDVDVAFGGSFFGLVNVEPLEVSLNKENIAYFRKIGLELRSKLNEELKVVHPELSHINKVDLVEFYKKDLQADCSYINLVVFGDGQFDRSPCGTGTSAKMALMQSNGTLQPGQKITSKSIIGSIFTGVYTDTISCGDYQAILPEITGRAFITGFNNLVVDERDPYGGGFVI
ncbi:MAG: proline racemase family protein [Bacillota bacterium]